MIDTREEWLRALDNLLARADRLVRIKDHDLRGQGWESPVRPALLEDFLRGARSRRVEILLHRDDYLTGHLPLLMRLLRGYNRQMEIRVYETLPPSEMAYALGDDRMLLYRHRSDAWAGRCSMDDPAGVIALTDRFQADWARIAGGLPYTPLGL